MAEHYSPPGTGATEDCPRLTLVAKGSPDALVFEHRRRALRPIPSSSTSAAVANRAVVEDVTRTYTPEDAWAEALARREHEGIDASCVAEAMRQAASIISQGVSD